MIEHIKQIPLATTNINFFPEQFVHTLTAFNSPIETANNIAFFAAIPLTMFLGKDLVNHEENDIPFATTLCFALGEIGSRLFSSSTSPQEQLAIGIMGAIIGFGVSALAARTR